jgi:mRNA interferase MazF
MNLQRGDVVLCRVPMPSTGLAQFKIRPAVVISANQLIEPHTTESRVIPASTNSA